MTQWAGEGCLRKEVLPNPLTLVVIQHTNGHLSADYKVLGHRQVSNTQSPGDELQKEIEKWPQWTPQ
ncbi:putative ubiquitin-conjugating enzyme E2 W, partial [Operophtera brumata]